MIDFYFLSKEGEINMYYNFGGFNTVQVLEYKLEDRDLRLISYIYAVQASDYMEYIEENGKLYFWLRNEKIIEDNPTLYVNERTLNSMIANLKDKYNNPAHWMYGEAFFDRVKRLEY